MNPCLGISENIYLTTEGNYGYVGDIYFYTDKIYFIGYVFCQHKIINKPTKMSVSSFFVGLFIIPLMGILAIIIQDANILSSMFLDTLENASQSASEKKIYSTEKDLKSAILESNFQREIDFGLSLEKRIRKRKYFIINRHEAERFDLIGQIRKVYKIKISKIDRDGKLHQWDTWIKYLKPHNDINFRRWLEKKPLLVRNTGYQGINIGVNVEKVIHLFYIDKVNDNLNIAISNDYLYLKKVIDQIYNLIYDDFSKILYKRGFQSFLMILGSDKWACEIFYKPLLLSSRMKIMAVTALIKSKIPVLHERILVASLKKRGIHRKRFFTAMCFQVISILIFAITLVSLNIDHGLVFTMLVYFSGLGFAAGLIWMLVEVINLVSVHRKYRLLNPDHCLRGTLKK